MKKQWYYSNSSQLNKQGHNVERIDVFALLEAWQECKNMFDKEFLAAARYVFER